MRKVGWWIMTVVVLCAAARASAVGPELVLYYDFNVDHGNVAVDASGYGNDGVISGATFQVVGCGGAMWFDGTNDYIRIPASASLHVSNGVTMSAWCWLTDYSRQRPILEWNNGTNIGTHFWTGVWGYQWQGKGTGANLVDASGNEVTHVVGATNPPAAQWVHLAVTYDRGGGVGCVYINGELAAQRTVGSFALATAADLYISRRPTESACFWQGFLDEIRVYDGPLSSSQIAALYAETAHCEPGFGRVRVTLDPQAARLAGARWRLAEGVDTNWHESGYATGDLATGTYTVAFKDIGEGWTAPPAATVTVTRGITSTFNGVYYPVVQSNALVLHYDMTEPPANDVAVDLSGYGNHGSVTGVAFVTTSGGGAWAFDGARGFVHAPSSASLDVDGSLTLSVCAKLYDFNDQIPLLEWNSGAQEGVHMWAGVPGWLAGGTGGNLVQRETHITHECTAPNPATNLWHVLTLTYNAPTGDADFYVDGVRRRHVAFAPFLPETRYDFWVGRRPGSPSFIHGLLRDVRVYRGALSSNDVKSLSDECLAGQPLEGSVRVTLNPSGARTAGAQWRLTSGFDTGWKNSGDAVHNLATGTYAVAFKPLTGWTAPSNLAATVLAGAQTALTGTYTTASVTEPALVLYYSFNTDNGGTAVDQSAQGNDGVISGAVFQASDCGGAMYFDGEHDFIRVPGSASLHLTDSLTLAAWFKVVNYNRQRPILEWSEGQRTGVHMWTGVWGWQWSGLGTGANLIDAASDGSHVVSTADPAPLLWHHLVVTYDRDNGMGRVYLDGTLANERLLGDFAPLTAGDLYIGLRPSSDPSRWYGWLDEIRVYNGALSAAAVQSLFLSTNACEPSMGMLHVQIGPPAALAAGARWQLLGESGTNWYPGGATLVNLAEGLHTVAYRPLTGWTAPSNQAVTLVRGTLQTVTGLYSGAQVDVEPPVILAVAPPDGYVTDTSSVPMTIVVSDNTGVSSVLVNGNPATTADGSNFVYMAEHVRGSYNPFQIVASDLAGNTAAASVNYAQANRLHLDFIWNGYWRVRNPHDVDTAFTWTIVDSDEAGDGVAPAHGDAYFTTSLGHMTVKLWVDGQLVDVKESFQVPPDPLGLATGALDSDGDGFSNFAEDIAGTAADDPNSFPMLGVAPLPPAPASILSRQLLSGGGDVTALILTWVSVQDVQYALEASEDLRHWFILPDAAEIWGTGDVMSYTNRLTDPNVFMRLKAVK